MNLLFSIALMLLVTSCWAADTTAPLEPSSLSGEVLEIHDVDSYTYLRLNTKDGDAWAAVNRTPVQKGARVTIENPVIMNDFESKSLNRKFDKIVFGILAGSGPRKGGDLAALHAGVSKPVDVGDVTVAKATGPNARTIAEIVDQSPTLKNTTVVVRGKVVKFTPGVLGKNWLHLRDGSGSAATNNNDVLVTTSDEAKIGDVLVVKGVVHTDRDLGSGYAYKVLIEDATLQK